MISGSMREDLGLNDDEDGAMVPASFREGAEEPVELETLTDNTMLDGMFELSYMSDTNIEYELLHSMPTYGDYLASLVMYKNFLIRKSYPHDIVVMKESAYNTLKGNS